MTQDTTTTNRPDSTKKLRKKLAKREAKLMLRIENTKQKLQRGEQRLGRLQAKLEQRSGRLHDLEKKLEEVRTLSTAHTHTDEQRIESAQPGSQNGSSPTTQNDSKDEGHSKDTPSDVVQEVAEPDLTT